MNADMLPAGADTSFSERTSIDIGPSGADRQNPMQSTKFKCSSQFWGAGSPARNLSNAPLKAGAFSI
jgi:hypothetical protein